MVERSNVLAMTPGIPYAEPPLGDLRWAPPVPSAGWSGVLDGGQPHMMCVQVLASWHHDVTSHHIARASLTQRPPMTAGSRAPVPS